jgi:uncharacterized membrane protein
MICLSGTAMGVDYVFEEIVIDGASDSVAYGINNNNVVVGKFYNQTGRHGFIYGPGPGTLQTLDFSGTDVVQTVATGINEAGNVVGYFRDRVLGRLGFYYDGSYSPIDYTGAWMTMAWDINNNTVNEVAGSFLNFPPFEGFGFIYDIVTPAFVNFIEGFYTTGFGINDAGEVVGGVWQAPEFPMAPSYDQFGYFRASDGTITEIKYLDINTCFYTDAYDINNNGVILGNYSCYSNIADPAGHGGFLINTATFPDYDDADFDVIDLSGSPHPAAFYWVYYGINDSGVIVGGYMDSTGWHAFKATPAGP